MTDIMEKVMRLGLTALAIPHIRHLLFRNSQSEEEGGKMDNRQLSI